VSVFGHPGDERIASQNIDRKSKIFSFQIAKEQSNCVPLSNNLAAHGFRRCRLGISD
jgi:hypothetical protein